MALPTPPQDAAICLLTEYFDAFNSGDEVRMLATLADGVVHRINQGQTETGKEAFAAFLRRMDACYREQLAELVLMADPSGTRAAAEFLVHGTYLSTDDGLPPARGQTYCLPAGAFFSINGGRIDRVTLYYNLQDWLRQIGHADT